MPRPIAYGLSSLAILSLALMPGGSAAAQPLPPGAHDVAEPSAALIDVAPVTPENLFVGSVASAWDDRGFIYAARQWMDVTLPNTSSIWRSPWKGGGATRIVTAGDGEWLLTPRTAPGAGSVYFTVGGAIYGVSRSGTAGSGAPARRRQAASGYSDYAPIPFADGQRLLFASCVAGRDCFFQDTNYIWVVGADGSELTQLRQGRDAQPSPDGKTIVFSYKGDIWAMQADGSEARSLTSSADVDTQPTFTPDGQRILFTRVVTSAPVRQADIWMMNADGSGPVQLTASPAEDAAPLAGPDGFVYFLSNRGPLVGTQRPSRIWRARIAPAAPAAPVADMAAVPPPVTAPPPAPAPAATAPATR